MRAEVPPRNRAERRAAMRHTAKRAGAAGAALTASTAAFAAALLAPGSMVGAAAATYTVDSNGDGAANAAHCTDVTAGNCTLRDAIEAANTNAGTDTVNFSVASPITLTQGQITTLESVDIVGPGAAALTISASPNSRTFYLSSNAGVTDVTISGLTLTNGNVDGDGGAIRNVGQHLTISNSVITGNTADGDGGGIASGHEGNTLTVIDSLITGNTANARDGGGILAEDGTLIVRGTELSGNTAYDDGGAIEARDMPGVVSISDSRLINNVAKYGQGGGLYTDDLAAPLSLTNVTVTGNSSHGGGGGLAIFDSAGNVTISNSNISGNTTSDAGGGIQSDDLYAGNTFSVIASTISGNHSDANGGGLYTGEFEGNLLVRNSTISGNTSDGGGGGVELYFMYGSSQIFNSTISGNVAGGPGGGIYFVGYAGGLDLVQTTITGNTGAGIGGIYSSDFNDLSASQNARRGDSNGDDVGTAAKGKVHGQAHGAAAAGGQINVVGTIVAKNSGYDIGPGGTIVSQNSLIGTKSTGVTLTDAGGTLLGLDPLLGPLANNGGPTQTHALTGVSPAINAGPVPLPDFPGNDNDQRGAGYPRVTNGRVDIGAYETPQVVVIIPTFAG